VALLDELVIEHQYIQKQPNMSVELRLDRPGMPSLFGKGFSKVHHPDVWDAEYGYALACQKALADITRQLIAEQDTITTLADCLRRFPESSGFSFAPGPSHVGVLVLDIPKPGDMGEGC